MEKFRSYLQHQLILRISKNPAYSLRAFALQLGLNHATLSSLISGKRKITQATFNKISNSLNLSPAEIGEFLESKDNQQKNNYFILHQDSFLAMSEWYYDAILELFRIPNQQLDAKSISSALGITPLQAKAAIETLERLELVTIEKGNYKLKHKNSTNLLDLDFTSAANRKYQKSILNKSIEAVETIDRKDRDHTSTTMAINKKDLPKAKELIQKFRHEMDQYLQRGDVTPNDVYQLQVSFFPLTNKFKKTQ